MAIFSHGGSGLSQRPVEYKGRPRRRARRVSAGGSTHPAGVFSSLSHWTGPDPAGRLGEGLTCLAPRVATAYFFRRSAMRLLLRLLVPGAVLALVPGVAFSQPPFGGGFGRGNPALLLGQESVRKELKLSAEQIKKVEEQSAK